MTGLPRIPAGALSSDLAARLRGSGGPVVVRNHPDSQPDRPRRWLLLPLVAATTFGGLTAALVPGAPFSQPASIALLAGACLLGAWLAASRSNSLRPSAGQGMVLGPASLVVVHHDHVEVLPAESLEIAEGKILFRGEVFDHGEHDRVWIETVQAAIEAARRHEVDPWREAATVAERGGSRATRIAIGAALGLVLAVGVELAPLSKTSAGAWTQARDSFDRQVAWINGHEQALYEKVFAEFNALLPTATTTAAVMPILIDVEARGLGEDFERPTRARLATLARAELDAAATSAEVEPVVRIALAGHLPGEVLESAKIRFAALADVELGANSAPETFEHFLSTGALLELGDAYRDSLVTRLIETGGARVAAAKGHGEVAPYVSLCVVYDLRPEFCEPTRARYSKLAASALRSASEDTLDEIEAMSRSAELDDELDKPLEARRQVLAAAAIDKASTPELLAKAVATWLDRVDPEFAEKLQPRVFARGSKLGRGERSSRELAILIPLVSDDEGEALYARYQEMAAHEARVGGITEVRAFLDAPDFSDHPARPEIEKRLVTVCDSAYRVPEIDDDKLSFFSSLLAEMCRRKITNLPYRIGRTDVENVADAAPGLAKAAQEVSTLLGAPIPVEAVLHSDALIVLSVHGFASVGQLSYPCTLEIERLFEAKGPKEISVLGTCVRILGDWK